MPTDVAPIVRALNGVKSNAQARAAAGAALRYLHDTYPLLDRVPNTHLRAPHLKELDGRRVAIEDGYRKIEKAAATFPVDAATWKALRRAIEGAYIDGSGLEAVIGYVPATSNADILLTSIREAPAVFLKSAATAAKAVTKEAAQVVGTAAGGLFSGLGLWAVVLMVVAALAVLVRMKGIV